MKKELQTINKGMHSDNNEEFQPEGSYRFALNLSKETLLGEMGGKVNERGTVNILSLPTDIDDYSLVGSCLLPNNDKVIFLTNDEIQIIALHKSNNEYEELIRTNCLDYGKCDQIDCLFKVHNGCEYIIYFTDHVNKYKSINISDLIKYQTSGYMNDLGGTDPNVPNTSGPNTIYGWNCGLFNMSPDVSHPDILLNSISNQGNLRLGAYIFFIRLLDSDQNASDWINYSNPIYITKPVYDELNVPLNNGGNIGNPGDDGFYYTNKAINLALLNLDTDYTYYQIGIVEKAGQTDTITNSFIAPVKVIPSSGEDVYVFSNINDTTLLEVDFRTFSQITTKINIVKAHTQVENRLLLGNVQGIVEDWIPFQKAVNNIKVEYLVNTRFADLKECEDTQEYWISTGQINAGDRITNFSDPEFLAHGKTFMRDEIYALGMVYVFDDGSQSPVFHIPGRPKFADNPVNNNEVNSYIIDGFDYAAYMRNTAQSLQFDGVTISPTVGIADFDIQELTSSVSSHFVTNNYDDDLYRYTYGFDDTISCCEYVNFNYNNCNVNVERWQYYNTAIRRKTDHTDWSSDDALITISNEVHEYIDSYIGLPGYYDTGQKYPEVLDCEGGLVFPGTIVNNEIIMDNVRHHRMPDCKIEPLFEKNKDFVTPDDIDDADDDLDTREYTIDKAEKTFLIKDLALLFRDVVIPTGYEDRVVGYYFVRSDRTNNKTVIDKGFMNICDTNIQLKFFDPTTPATGAFQTEGTGFELRQNELFMCATQKTKAVTQGGVTAYEIHTPKSTFGEPVALSADYMKLEATYFGELFFFGTTQEVNPGGGPYTSFVVHEDRVNPDNNIWKAGLAVVFNETKPPRVGSRVDRWNLWEFMYNIPIQGLEYALFNTKSSSSLFLNCEINNEFFQQRALIAKSINSCIAEANTSNFIIYDTIVNVPGIPVEESSIIDYTASNFCSLWEPAWRFNEDGYKVNINSIFSTNQGYPNFQYDIEELIAVSRDPNQLIGDKSWSSEKAVGGNYSPFHSPYCYYIGLKSNIRPYQNLDQIRYVKMHSQLIRPGLNNTPSGDLVPVDGGDCFISRFQVDKSWYDTEPGDPVDSDFRYTASTMIGYVESEINTHYRHIQPGDVYRAYPWNTHTEVLKDFWEEVFTFSADEDELNENISNQEIKYNYILDYSSNNSEFILSSLSDAYDYCSDCPETFPNTILYSEVSLPDQIFDNYRNFLANSTKDIPADTGQITNLFIKEANLFAHTENNLWRINISPQQLKTGTDTIQVGQGDFLGLTPTKMFDTKEGYAYGGTIDKFASVYAENNYIWVDRKSGSIFNMNQGIQKISDMGLSRFFDNELRVNLDFQYDSFTSNPYPNNGTACQEAVGYRACYDPVHNRYILTKKDYKLGNEVLEKMSEAVIDPITGLYDPPLVQGDYYYNADGFFVATANGNDPNQDPPLLVPIAYNDKDIVENKSWTISYDIDEKYWLSFHSYIPNWLYNDSNTFYTHIVNSLNDKYRFVWEHNFGNFQTYYDEKFDFIFDYIYKKNPFTEKTTDTIEYTSNVYLESEIDLSWIEVQFVTFDKFYVYNNNQISNMKTLTVSNLLPYYSLNYDINEATVHKNRNNWRISRFRDLADSRLLNSEPLFSSDWSKIEYSDYFNNGYGYIDKIINDDILNINKSVYEQSRFTDKYLGVRLFFKPEENYKIIMNLITGLKRDKI